MRCAMLPSSKIFAINSENKHPFTCAPTQTRIRARSHRSPKTERERRVASSAVMANGHQISVVPLPPSSSTVVSVRRSARPSIRGGLSAARRHRAGGLISANCVRESPALFCSPSLEPRRRWKGKGRGTEGMSSPTRPSHSLSCVPILSLF